jgi:hypothetical protein
MICTASNSINPDKRKPRLAGLSGHSVTLMASQFYAIQHPGCSTCSPLNGNNFKALPYNKNQQVLTGVHSEAVHAHKKPGTWPGAMTGLS